jgi:hypothetical protein
MSQFTVVDAGDALLRELARAVIAESNHYDVSDIDAIETNPRHSRPVTAETFLDSELAAETYEVNGTAVSELTDDERATARRDLATDPDTSMFVQTTVELDPDGERVVSAYVKNRYFGRVDMFDSWVGTSTYGLAEDTWEDLQAEWDSVVVNDGE